MIKIFNHFTSERESLSKNKKLISSKIKINRNKIQEIIANSSTPIYIYFTKSIHKQLKKLEKKLVENFDNFKIAYSFKTNYDIARLKLLPQEQIAAEVVSEKEYQMAIESGYKKTSIIYNGPYKSKKSISQAIKNKSLINIDNFNEIQKISSLSGHLEKTVKTGLRLNVRGEKSRFGFRIDTKAALKAFQMVNKNKNLKLKGFHLHLGTNIDSAKTYQKGTKKLTQFVSEIYNTYQFKPSFLDFGGGFPTQGPKPYSRKTWNPQKIANYLNAISKELKKNYPFSKLPTIIIEPGRFLVNNSAILISKVLTTDKKSHLQTITINTTISALPIKYYQPIIAQAYTPKLKLKNSPKVKTIIYGCSCRENDKLYEGAFNLVNCNDYIVFGSIGAYNKNLSSGFIFNKPRAKFI